MNNKLFEKRMLSFPLLIMASVFEVNAQTCYNNRVLAAAASSAAAYTVNCPAGTDYLTARVNLQAGAGTGQSVRLQIQKAGFVSSTVAVDSTNGGSFGAMPTCALPTGTVPSTWISLKPSAQKAGALGSGLYNILITKTGNTAFSYGYNFSCVQSTPSPPTVQSSLTPSTSILVGVVSKSTTTDVYVFAKNRAEFNNGRGMSCWCYTSIPGRPKKWKGEKTGGVCTNTGNANINGQPYAGYRQNGKWKPLTIPTGSCCTTNPENQPKLNNKKIPKDC